MWHWLFVAPWLVFAGWWLFRARGNAAVARAESPGSRMSYWITLAAAAVIFTLGPRVWPHRLWHASLIRAIAMLALEVAGVAFAIWAREHLGAMWSGRVTLKEGHRIVKSGPYAIARHPIYTGIFFGLVAVVVVRGEITGFIGLALFLAGIARKIQMEERLLVGHFGDEYLQYRRETRALIPFVI
jgi:protein-S-isoprenylcysteine O-methyltransferase Ste14